MLKIILDTVKGALRRKGAENVFTAFDAAPVERKGNGFYTVIGTKAFETLSPIYSQYTIFMPYKASVEVSVTAPENLSFEKLYSYYDSFIEPALFSIHSLTCSLSELKLKHDTNINRLVLTAVISVSGIHKISREEQ